MSGRRACREGLTYTLVMMIPFVIIGLGVLAGSRKRLGLGEAFEGAVEIATALFLIISLVGVIAMGRYFNSEVEAVHGALAQVRRQPNLDGKSERAPLLLPV
jgi:hypothetical protein